MGYTTDFYGAVEVTPPMKPELVEFLTKFAQTRRMHRKKGPDYVDGTGFMGQGADDDVIDHNRPPPGQPGLWCQWVPTDDGQFIGWDGGEKFYESAAWMKYIIDRYIAPAGHVCNGTIDAQGEDPDDRWALEVKDNKVFVSQASFVYGDSQEVA